MNSIWGNRPGSHQDGNGWQHFPACQIQNFSRCSDDPHARQNSVATNAIYERRRELRADYMNRNRFLIDSDGLGGVRSEHRHQSIDALTWSRGTNGLQTRWHVFINFGGRWRYRHEFFWSKGGELQVLSHCRLLLLDNHHNRIVFLSSPGCCLGGGLLSAFNSRPREKRSREHWREATYCLNGRFCLLKKHHW